MDSYPPVMPGAESTYTCVQNTGASSIIDRLALLGMARRVIGLVLDRQTAFTQTGQIGFTARLAARSHARIYYVGFLTLLPSALQSGPKSLRFVVARTEPFGHIAA